MRYPHGTIGAAAFAALVALDGCSSAPPPVPLAGSPTDIARLEGEWVGEYSSAQTLRSGSITFTLAAGADTAFGDVLMLPRQFQDARTTDQVRTRERVRPQTLPIRFVMTSGDRLSGVLDPYEDPECGCTLMTLFEGRIEAGTIEGSYVSTNTQTGEVTRGEWKVTRRRAASPAVEVGNADP